MAEPANAAAIGPSFVTMRPFIEVSSHDVISTPGRHEATRLVSLNRSQTTARGFSMTNVSSTRVQPGRSGVLFAVVRVPVPDADRLVVGEAVIGSKAINAVAGSLAVAPSVSIGTVRFAITDAIAFTMPT